MKTEDKNTDKTQPREATHNSEKNTDRTEARDGDQNNSEKNARESQDENFPGYPHYPASEDIFNNEKEVDLNPENIQPRNNNEEIPGTANQNYFETDLSSEDLDISGSAEDEVATNSDSEDQANHNFSLGVNKRENSSEE